MAHRFFVKPGSMAQGRVLFDAGLAHRLRNVLRLRPGARVIVLDNSGWEYDYFRRYVEIESNQGYNQGAGIGRFAVVGRYVSGK